MNKLPLSVLVLFYEDSEEVIAAYSDTDELLKHYTAEEIKEENFRVAEYVFSSEGEVKPAFFSAKKKK